MYVCMYGMYYVCMYVCMYVRTYVDVYATKLMMVSISPSHLQIVPRDSAHFLLKKLTKHMRAADSSTSPHLNQANLVVGYMGVVIVIVMFSSPLSVIQHVIQTRNTASLPPLFTFASFLNCVLCKSPSICHPREPYSNHPQTPNPRPEARNP